MSSWVQRSWYNLSLGGESHVAVSASVEWLLILVTTALSLGMAYLSFKRFSENSAAKDSPGVFANASRSLFFVDEIYQFVLINPLRYLSGLLTKVVDTWIINGALHLLRDGSKMSGQVLSLFHTGNLQTYAWYFAFGVASLLGFLWTVSK